MDTLFPYTTLFRSDFQAAAVIGQIVGHLEGTIGLLLCDQPRQISFVDRGVGRRESESAYQDAGQHAGILAEGDFRSRLFSRPEIIEDYCVGVGGGWMAIQRREKLHLVFIYPEGGHTRF